MGVMTVTRLTVMKKKTASESSQPEDSQNSHLDCHSKAEAENSDSENTSFFFFRQTFSIHVNTAKVRMYMMLLS